MQCVDLQWAIYAMGQCDTAKGQGLVYVSCVEVADITAHSQNHTPNHVCYVTGHMNRFSKLSPSLSGAEHGSLHVGTRLLDSHCHTICMGSVEKLTLEGHGSNHMIP